MNINNRIEKLEKRTPSNAAVNPYWTMPADELIQLGRDALASGREIDPSDRATIEKVIANYDSNQQTQTT